jgi:protein phosphatase PTC7
VLHRTGSSTACVLVVNGTTLSASNLGDSGFVLVRDGVATFQCPQQQHNFNFPFQLGSADSMSDQPQAAMVRQQQVRGGQPEQLAFSLPVCCKNLVIVAVV